MRILILNYFYPPVVDAHAYRWEQIARAWVAQGHRVDVVCGRLHGVPNRSAQAGVDVIRVGPVSRSVMLSPPPAPGAVKLRARLRSAIVNVLRPLYRGLYWPDAWWHWWPSALREVWGRRSDAPDLVVSYSPCLGAHLAAAALKWRTRSSGLVWIADYGDPFSTSSTMRPNNFALYRRLNRVAERYVGRRANAVAFTNAGTAADYQAAGICAPDKVRVIPHLVDVQRLYAGALRGHGSKAGVPGNPRETRLLYIGGFHRGIREPDLLFEIMRRLNRQPDRRYVLTIHGPSNGFDLSPADCPQVRYEGMIERDKALDLIREADVLVNVDNMNCVMVPSKIVEYIATGRPMLNLRSGGVVHPAVARYAQCGFALELSRDDLDSDSDSANAAAVARFLDRTAGTVAPLDTVERVLDGCALPNVAAQYMALARQACQPAPGGIES